MARGEVTIDNSLSVVRGEVLEYAQQRGWENLSGWGTGSSTGQTELVFGKIGFVLSGGQRITVSAEEYEGKRCRVVVETRAKDFWGLPQLFDWGEGRRIVRRLLDALTTGASSR